jgi:hypothetical protein
VCASVGARYRFTPPDTWIRPPISRSLNCCAKPHIRKATTAALAASALRLTVEWLPKYAPQRNDVWHDLKAHHLARQTFTDVDALDRAIHVVATALNAERNVAVGQTEYLCLGPSCHPSSRVPPPFRISSLDRRAAVKHDLPRASVPLHVASNGHESDRHRRSAHA